MHSNDTSPEPAFPPLWIAWLIWGLGTLFYLMGFFQRVAPAVMTRELMRDFEISAAGLGSLSGFYFYSYVAMQIPTGLLADSLGPRRLLSWGAGIAGIGTLIFAQAGGIGTACIGRLLIGGSVAVAFVGLLKLSSSWFPNRLYAFVTGIALLVGVVGAVLAGTPLRLLLDHYEWRSVITASAAVTVFLSLAIWLLVRDYPHEKGFQDLSPVAGSGERVSLISTLKGVGEVFKNRNALVLFAAPGGIVGCVLTFSGLWGVPYLVTHYGLTQATAAMYCSVLMVAWAVGGPVFGWLSDWIGRRKPFYIAGATVLVAGWSLILFTDAMSPVQLTAVMVITGFSSGCMIIGFAFARESLPPRLSGTVSGVVNTGVMSGPMLLQPAVGWVLDANWDGGMSEAVRVYTAGAYHAGFTLMIGWVVLAWILLLFSRETFCRQA